MSTRIPFAIDGSYLQIGERRVQAYAPVDETVGPVQEAFLVQAAEVLVYSFAQLLQDIVSSYMEHAERRFSYWAHGECRARPVIATTETVELFRDSLLITEVM